MGGNLEYERPTLHRTTDSVSITHLASQSGCGHDMVQTGATSTRRLGPAAFGSGREGMAGASNTHEFEAQTLTSEVASSSFFNSKPNFVTYTSDNRDRGHIHSHGFLIQSLSGTLAVSAESMVVFIHLPKASPRLGAAPTGHVVTTAAKSDRV